MKRYSLESARINFNYFSKKLCRARRFYKKLIISDILQDEGGSPRIWESRLHFAARNAQERGLYSARTPLANIEWALINYAFEHTYGYTSNGPRTLFYLFHGGRENPHWMVIKQHNADRDFPRPRRRNRRKAA